MNCNAVQTRLSAYLDRELTGEELLVLRAHLSVCPECRQAETELRLLKSLLGQMTAPEPSTGFGDRLCASVLRTRERTQPRFGVARSILTFGGVAAASMVATFFVVSLREEAPQALQADRDSVAIEIAQDQAFSVGADPTEGSSLTRFAEYAGR